MIRRAVRPNAARLAALILAMSAAPPVTGDEPLLVPFHAQPAALDGRLAEDAWRSSARIEQDAFTRWVAARYERDVSPFNVRLFHDGRRLYVAIASYDRFVEHSADAETADGLYAFSLITTAGVAQHYRLRWVAPAAAAGGEMLEGTEWSARLRGPFADPKHEGGGYVFEFALPLDRLGWQPGGDYRINIIVQDHDGNPGARYDDPKTEFARFAFGSLDNDDLSAYRVIRLAPTAPARAGSSPARARQ